MNKFWAGMAAVALALAGTAARAGDFPTGPGCCEPPPLSADTPTAWDQNCDGRAFEGFYADGGYMLWWLEKQPLPPLITSAFGDPANANVAAVGQSGASVLFGGAGEGSNGFNGGRLTVGYKAQGIGIEASGFFLGQKVVRASYSNGGGANDPIIGIPYFDTTANAETYFLVAGPDVQAGTVTVSLASQLAGADLSLTGDLIAGPGYHVTALAGLRYLQLDEYLQEASNVVALDTPQGEVLLNNQTTVDNFITHNHFFGGQVGIDAELHGPRFGIEFIGKLAYGLNEEDTNINGSTKLTPNPFLIQLPGNPPPVGTTIPQGVFAESSNGGHHRFGEFALAPEVEIRFSYLVAQQVKISVGYSFLDITNVVRPGIAIDRGITNLNSVFTDDISGPRPAFNRTQTNFYAHGLDLSVAIGF
jgi:hypothetical protein